MLDTLEYRALNVSYKERKKNKKRGKEGRATKPKY
jgi:hypothetical protein